MGGVLGELDAEHVGGFVDVDDVVEHELVGRTALGLRG
jgi:hypothetical protein